MVNGILITYNMSRAAVIATAKLNYETISLKAITLKL